MATRFYFTSDAAPYSPATLKGTWSDSTLFPANDYNLSPTKSGTNTAVARAETSTTNNFKVFLHRHVSGPLAGGTIVGGAASTFNHVQARQETAAANNLTIQIHIYFTVGDSDTVRHSYVNSFTGATEFDTAMTAFSYTSVAPVAGVISAGDRMVIEMGYNAANTSSTSGTGTLRIGGTAGDLATSGTTGVTTNSPWFEFLGTGSDAAVAPYVPPLNQGGFMTFF